MTLFGEYDREEKQAEAAGAKTSDNIAASNDAEADICAASSPVGLHPNPPGTVRIGSMVPAASADTVIARAGPARTDGVAGVDKKCPMCMRSFVALDKLERHAAVCTGSRVPTRSSKQNDGSQNFHRKRQVSLYGTGAHKQQNVSAALGRKLPLLGKGSSTINRQGSSAGKLVQASGASRARDAPLPLLVPLLRYICIYIFIGA